MRKHKFLHKIVLQEMKKRLHIPNILPPLKTVAHGYEYYSTTSVYGMVYLRKKLGEGKDAPEVVYTYKTLYLDKPNFLLYLVASAFKLGFLEVNEYVDS